MPALDYRKLTWVIVESPQENMRLRKDILELRAERERSNQSTKMCSKRMKIQEMPSKTEKMETEASFSTDEPKKAKAAHPANYRGYELAR